MDRLLSVKTPESIAFSYELAGLGSRFLALAIDMAVQVALLLALFWGATLAASGVPVSRGSLHYGDSFAIAFLVAVIFTIFFGYFILFEAFWNGQTPGKRLMGVRVVRDGGYPIDFAAAAIRNLVRVGEFTAGFYAISAIVAILSPESKRLGDMAAGTIVVRDSRTASLASIVESGERADEARTSMITQREHALIDRFVARRAGMESALRAQIAARLAQRVRARVSYDLQRLDDEELLARISGS